LSNNDRQQQPVQTIRLQMQLPALHVLSQHSYMWHEPGCWHHQQQLPLPAAPQPQPTWPQAFRPVQQTGGAADAFPWVASVPAAAAPMITAPTRAKNPARLMSRPAGAVTC
jgi:hypothetical protein